MRSRPDPYPVRPHAGVNARFRPPGSRSLANRALVVAALARGESLLSGIGANDDTRVMRACLEALGITLTPRGRTLHVQGGAGRLKAPAQTLDVGASGTTARFLCAASTLADGALTLDGAPRMRERPIAELAEALQQLGAEIRVLGPGGCPPLAIGGGGLPGGRAVVDASASSQFVSALLLAAPCAQRDVEVHLEDGALVSRPFVEMTLEVMRAFHAAPEWVGEAALRAPAGGYRSAHYEVEADAQSAVYGFCAAAICGGRAEVLGIPRTSLQADLGILDALRAMGCRVSREADAIRVEGPSGRLRGIEVSGRDWPDAVLALAVTALFAEGPTTIRDIAHLRIKESDRLAALACELRRLGARAEATDSALRIEPMAAQPGPAVVETYNDHRMAMSFALAGLAAPGIAIQDPGCVSKTWPEFFDVLESW